jgi:hypothetical protein
MTTRQQPDSLLQSHTAATGIAASAVAHAPASMPARVSRSRPRAPGRFLRGPILWAWLARAMPLPGKAMQVAIQIWHDVELAKSNEVSISMTGMAKVGISRFAASRGLAALEKSGLVSVVRHAGRKPQVVLVATAALSSAALVVGGDTTITSPIGKDSAEVTPLPPDEPAPSGE